MGTEATAGLSCGDERRQSGIPPGPSPNYPVTEYSSDEGTAKDCETPTHQENGPEIDTENRTNNQRSCERADSEDRTSSRDKGQSRHESDSPRRMITTVVGAPIIDTTGEGDSEEDTIIKSAFKARKENIYKAIQKLITIENYFDKK